jgi:hypothetical protein
MNAYQDFEAFLLTLGLTPTVRLAILDKFEDLRSDIIDEHDRVRAESRQDGRS